MRVNHKIKAPQVSVIDDAGTQLGLLTVPQAIEAASERGLDLVEVAPQAKPPVCRFMDYGKFKYRKNKKAHEAKKNQKYIRVKEIKVTPRTSEHDYNFKLNHIKKFLGEGNKAKVTVFFRGRQITHTELGRVMLDKFIVDTQEYATVGQGHKMEGRRMNIVLEPKAQKTEQKAPKSKQATVAKATVEKKVEKKKETEGEKSAKD